MSFDPITAIWAANKAAENAGGGVSSWNDLTDKPFYDGRKTIFCKQTGTLDGIPVFMDSFYQISGETPALDEFLGVKMTAVSVVGTETATFDMVMLDEEAAYALSNSGGVPLFVVLNEGEIILGEQAVTLPPRGIYFMGEFVANADVTFEYGSIHPIDPKYIPAMDSLTLVSPDGTSYKVTVDDSGNLAATAT